MTSRYGFGVNLEQGGRPLSRQFRRPYGDSPYGFLMTWHVERAVALLRRAHLRRVASAPLDPRDGWEQATRPIRNREARTPEPQLA
jgi:hypothetical protein